MPIKYDVFRDGHFIHAVGTGVITAKDFVDYEIAHPMDKRVKEPLNELIEIQPGATMELSKKDISEIIDKRKTIKGLPTLHKCAIVVPYVDSHSWDLARYYEGMAELHYPKSVIVFGNMQTARIWLGVEDKSPEEQVFMSQQ